MPKRKAKSQPTWTDVKAKLADFDRAALLGLIQGLYTAHKDNQTFLHARFGLGEDVLEPYKKIIDRWLWPDVLRRNSRFHEEIRGLGVGQDDKSRLLINNLERSSSPPAF